jgi:signal transduction histidine kinase
LDDFPPFDTSLDAQLALSGTRSALRDAEHLAETLRRMNETKAEQIESLNQHVVKTAADSGLGRSISSILHDLNGQFGVAVTGSHMVKESLDIINEELSRTDPNIDVMRNAMIEVNEMNAIVRQSVLRGLEFIGNHKVISIDQVSSRERDVVLADYLRQIVESMRPLAKHKNIEFEVTGDESVIVREPGLIAQMAMNLVENGFRHAFDGRKHGRITFHVLKDGDHIVLSYEDDGVGMSPDILDRHLDAFYTTKATEGGSGLGAYSIAVIVKDNLKGTLNVTSELGVGTRYEMRFPNSTITVPQA